MKKILVLGGGFAGIQAARALRGTRDAQVRMVSQTGDATMVPALPDVLAGRFTPEQLRRPLGDILPEDVELTRDTVRSVDLNARTVTGAGDTYRYDALVVALGSEPAPAPQFLSEFSVHSVHSLESTMELRRAVQNRLGEDAFDIAVVGAGYTGLETAAAIRHGTGDHAVRITVVDAAPEILPMLKERQRSRVLTYLSAREIDVRPGVSLQGVRDREGVRDSTLFLSDGTALKNPLVIWAAGMRASTVAFSGEISRSADGRVRTEDTLRVPGYPEVYVAGDAAALHRNGRDLRRAVNFAYYSGHRAGKNVARYLAGKPQKRFVPVDLGWVLPIVHTSAGRIFGTVPVGGGPGLRMHYFMCGYRHFGGGRGLPFFATALCLRRRPYPIVPATPRDPAEHG